MFFPLAIKCIFGDSFNGFYVPVAVGLPNCGHTKISFIGGTTKIYSIIPPFMYIYIYIYIISLN